MCQSVAYRFLVLFGVMVHLFSQVFSQFAVSMVLPKERECSEKREREERRGEKGRDGSN